MIYYHHHHHHYKIVTHFKHFVDQMNGEAKEKYISNDSYTLLGHCLFSFSDDVSICINQIDIRINHTLTGQSFFFFFFFVFRRCVCVRVCGHSISFQIHSLIHFDDNRRRWWEKKICHLPENECHLMILFSTNFYYVM